MNACIVFGAKYLFLVSIVLFLLVLARERMRGNKVLKFSLVSFPLSFLFAKLSSLLFYNPRPFVVNHVKPLISHVADNGFPSDHTLLCATIASAVFVFNKKIGSILFLMAAIVGISRIAANVHSPIDILGSFGIAITTAFLVRALSKRALHF